MNKLEEKQYLKYRSLRSNNLEYFGLTANLFVGIAIISFIFESTLAFFVSFLYALTNVIFMMDSLFANHKLMREIKYGGKKDE